MPYSLLEDTRSFSQLNTQLKELNSNLTKLQSLHNSFNQFNESVGLLIYGLNINAWCTEFPEAPNEEVFSQKSLIEEIVAKTRALELKIAKLQSETVPESRETKENGEKVKTGRIAKARRQSRIPQLKK